MKTKLIAILMLSTLVSVRGSSADAPAKPAKGDSSTVVFENDKVRCILYQAGSGKNVCGFGMHSHPAHLYIMQSPGKFRTITPRWQGIDRGRQSRRRGLGAAVTHRVECISWESDTCYLVEVKDKDWQPSNGLTK